MFQEYTHIQPAADLFKSLIHRSGLSQSKWRQTIRLINKIERAGWSPRAMQQAIDEVAQGRFSLVDGRLTFTPAADDDDAAVYVQRVLIRYAELVEFPLFGDLMGIEDAALYLGMSVIGLKKAIYRSEALTGQKPGHDLIFTRVQLDEFNRNRRPVGRPKPVIE